MDKHQVTEGNDEGSPIEARRKGVLVFVPDADLDDKLSWIALAQNFWADRRIHILVFCVCVAIAAAFAYAPQPIYRAQAVLLLVSNSPQSQLMSGLQSGGLASLAGLAGINLDAADDFRRESLALLTSRDFTIHFIQEENLLPLLYASKWDSTLGRWRTGQPEPTIDQALELFDRNIRSVSEDRRNGLTLVSIEWTDRSLAAKWANELVERANAELRQRTMQNSQRSLEFLRRELAKTTETELQQTLYRLMEAELKRNMLAAVREDYAFRVIDTARVPPANRRVRPQRTLILVIAFCVALAISGCIARLRAQPRRRDTEGKRHRNQVNERGRAKGNE
jgi:uncharacterized protein involved in exopolysaccharide biosynthesis